ncbi:MAG: CPBP family intramembrane glutamic endopeptidase, partial [Candidatus Eremiobacterota bacterium]
MSWEEFRPRFDRRSVLVLIPTALILVFTQYYGLAVNFSQLFPGVEASEPVMELYRLLWWAVATWTGYLLIPALLIKAQGMKLSDFGLRRPVGGAHMWLYAVLFLGSVPFLLMASTRDSFLDTYPFYRPGLEHPIYWFVFEIAYLLTFVTVEFFFRGFLVFGLEKQMGDLSVLVAAVPYCMIHFGKPMPETLAAILGALVLGILALRTRSIYGGVVVHQLIALTMDALALF